MDVRLSDQMIRDCAELERILREWNGQLRPQVQRAHGRIAQRWRSEAVKRVPVDEGTLKQRILANVYEDMGSFVAEVGTNLEYGTYLEFGTEEIAGGAVKALGYRTDITDAQAIHTWPAKQAEAVQGTSAMVDVGGGAMGRRRNAGGQFVKGGPQEQMPWLRPAFMVLRVWAINELAESTKPPKTRGA